MPYVYDKVDELLGKKAFGDGDCVTLIKEYTDKLSGWPTSRWKPGARVVDSPNLRRGTAIATFEDGKYPNHKHGNHAAFFLQHGGAGFWVMDQWRSKVFIDKRYIARRPEKDGKLTDPSNNALAFYVIEM
jgi:hypothetical protein